MSDNLLHFNNNEKTVLKLIREGLDTPLLIEKYSSISRQGAYKILHRLSEAGFIQKSGSTWKILTKDTIYNRFYIQAEQLLGIERNRDAQVRIITGRNEIADLLIWVFSNHKKETCIGIQGDNVYEDWIEILGLKTINQLNKSIKKNEIIIKAIVPTEHFKRAIKIMGREWATHFEGRPYQVNVIDNKYFAHEAEMFIFKRAVYIICLADQLVIEIKNKNIVDMILLLINYIQENSESVDGNQILRDLISE